MSAEDIIFEILKDIRKAINIITLRTSFSTQELIDLTAIYNHVNELGGDDIQLLYNRIELELASSHKFQKLCDIVSRDTGALIELYGKNEDNYNKACSFDAITTHVLETSKQQFSLKINCANEERIKWRNIVKLFDDAIELQESYNYVPEDKNILEEYLETLYDKVGYPIRKENLYPEYQKARIILKQKESILDDFNNQKRHCAEDLADRIKEDVIFEINVLSKDYYSVFTQEKSEENMGIAQKGRPKNKNKYEIAGIKDLYTCFIGHENYNNFVQIIQEQNTPLSSGRMRAFFRVLKEKKWLKAEISSYKDFAGFLLKEDEIKKHLSFHTKNSVYSGALNEGDTNYWINLMSQKNIRTND